MFDKKSRVVNISTLISEDAVVNGNISLSESIKIDGKVTGGVLTTGDVIIGENSVVTGNISGNNVIISGRVNGDISALGRISLMKDSYVAGDISYSALEIDDSAKFTGNCTLVAAPAEAEDEEDKAE